ncbi:MAG: sugar phosphate nucleotidyltransferase [Clostridia bacterium]|nr:sugar phosphate nucleotidyltransferase [Clostridia bacterium]
MTLVILAAGMGSRYGGLKQLDPITDKGEFIIDFSVYDAIRAGYDKVVFIIKEENYDLFRQTIGKRIEKYIETEYVFQSVKVEADVDVPADRVKPWGTAHALLSCLSVVNDNFAVINADDFYGPSSFKIVKNYLESVKASDKKEHFCISAYILENTLSKSGTVSRGVCTGSEDGMLVDIKEHTKIGYGEKNAVSYSEDGDTELDYGSLVSMNFFGFTPVMLEYIKGGFDRFLNSADTDLKKGEYYLPTAVKEAMEEGICDVKLLKTPDKWHGVTYIEDKPEVTASIKQLIQEGLYPDGLWK